MGGRKVATGTQETEAVEIAAAEGMIQELTGTEQQLGSSASRRARTGASTRARESHRRVVGVSR